MKHLDDFLKLSHYLKSYKLYCSFSEMNERNIKTISKIEFNLQDKEYLSDSEEKELEKYHQILQKINLNNKLLENSFNSYDFNEDTAQQAETDYKVYIFEFIVDTILNSLKDKELKLRKDIINHVHAAERIILKHFMEKFFLVDDLDKIFEKATENVLEQKFEWETSIQNENFNSDLPILK